MVGLWPTWQIYCTTVDSWTPTGYSKYYWVNSQQLKVTGSLNRIAATYYSKTHYSLLQNKNTVLEIVYSILCSDYSMVHVDYSILCGDCSMVQIDYGIFCGDYNMVQIN